MTVPTEPLSKLTHEAISVLTRELGVARTLRFLGQYRTGQGNYTEERHQFLGDGSLEELFEEARQIDRAREEGSRGR